MAGAKLNMLKSCLEKFQAGIGLLKHLSIQVLSVVNSREDILGFSSLKELVLCYEWSLRFNEYILTLWKT